MSSSPPVSPRSARQPAVALSLSPPNASQRSNGAGMRNGASSLEPASPPPGGGAGRRRRELGGVLGCLVRLLRVICRWLFGSPAQRRQPPQMDVQQAAAPPVSEPVREVPLPNLQPQVKPAEEKPDAEPAVQNLDSVKSFVEQFEQLFTEKPDQPPIEDVSNKPDEDPCEMFKKEFQAQLPEEVRKKVIAHVIGNWSGKIRMIQEQARKESGRDDKKTPHDAPSSLKKREAALMLIGQDSVVIQDVLRFLKEGDACLSDQE